MPRPETDTDTETDTDYHPTDAIADQWEADFHAVTAWMYEESET